MFGDVAFGVGTTVPSADPLIVWLSWSTFTLTVVVVVRFVPEGNVR